MDVLIFPKIKKRIARFVKKKTNSVIKHYTLILVLTNHQIVLKVFYDINKNMKKVLLCAYRGKRGNYSVAAETTCSVDVNKVSRCGENFVTCEW